MGDMPPGSEVDKAMKSKPSKKLLAGVVFIINFVLFVGDILIDGIDLIP